MRSRCHVLIATRAFADIIVCVYLIQVRAQILVGNTFMTRRQCVLQVAYGLVFENLQCSIGLALGVDRLLAIVTPVQYMKWPARQYLLLLLVPCCIFSLLLASFALWESSGESRVAICFTPSAYIDRAKSAWYGSNIAIILLQFAVHLYASVALGKTTGPSSIQMRKILLSLETVMVMYSICWALPIFASLLLQMITVSADAASIIWVMLGWPVILNSSCNFFIYATRSSEFRHAFLRLFSGKNTKTTPTDRITIPKAAELPKIA
uniref:G-protein coupled receptors family 1 profile domain-containing protein n=1 Tax=Plectus sambesii TaxID=2011161 RepID=A0A914X411_9BILA